jgi:hypothetical protein
MNEMFNTNSWPLNWLMFRLEWKREKVINALAYKTMFLFWKFKVQTPSMLTRFIYCLNSKDLTFIERKKSNYKIKLARHEMIRFSGRSSTWVSIALYVDVRLECKWLTVMHNSLLHWGFNSKLQIADPQNAEKINQLPNCEKLNFFFNRKEFKS